MRRSYLLDRYISKGADLVCPSFFTDLRKRVFNFIAPMLGRINVPWCYWPVDEFEYQIIKVNPFEINHEIKDGIVPLRDNTKFWERGRPFRPHKAIDEMFFKGKPYSETSQYKTMISKIDAGGAAYWCKSRQDVDRYFEDLVATYNSIKQDGYKRSEARINGEAKWQGDYPDEILVSIDHQGKMYLERGGTHRLTIARLLNLKEVYVAIIREHVGH